MDLTIPVQYRGLVEDRTATGTKLIIAIMEISRSVDTAQSDSNDIAHPKNPKTAPAKSQLSKFPKFQLLPLELRQEIWSHACFQRRYVELVPNTSGALNNPNVPWCTTKLKAHPNVPAILHTCRESRAEGLRHYKLPLEASPWSPLPIYINFACDIICLCFQYYYNNDELEELINVCRKNHARSVALNVHDHIHCGRIDLLSLPWDSLERIMLYDYDQNFYRVGISQFVLDRGLGVCYDPTDPAALLAEKFLKSCEEELSLYLKINAQRHNLEVLRASQSLRDDTSSMAIKSHPILECRHVVIGGEDTAEL